MNETSFTIEADFASEACSLSRISSNTDKEQAVMEEIANYAAAKLRDLELSQ